MEVIVTRQFFLLILTALLLLCGLTAVFNINLMNSQSVETFYVKTNENIGSPEASLTREILEASLLWGIYVEASGNFSYFGSSSAQGAFSLTAHVDENQATFAGMFISNEITYAITLTQTYDVKLNYAGYKFYLYGKWMIMGYTYPPYFKIGNGELKIYPNNIMLITITNVPNIWGVATYFRIIRYPYAIPLSDQPDIWVPQNYTTIQDAVNAASAGDLIFVSAGTYYEHVVVDKSVTLVGEDRDRTIIDGAGSGIIVTIASSNVTISNFTIRNSGKLGRGISWTENTLDNVNITGNILTSHGIGITGLSNVSHENFYILGNNISDNLIGVHVEDDNVPPKVLGNIIIQNSIGIQLENVNNTRIVDNIIFNNTQYGIKANRTFESVFLGNNITMNGVGISLFNSGNVTVGYNLLSKGDTHMVEEMESFQFIGNTVTNNTNNGLTIMNATNTVITGNQILSNEKDGLLLTMKQVEPRLGVVMADNVISENGKNGLIANFNFKVEIEGVAMDNIITDNGEFGVYLQNSAHALFENNTISGNGFSGVFLDHSTNTTLADNTITNNGYSADAISYPYRSGLYLNMSDNCIVVSNNVSYNRDHGIAIENSYGLNVSGNLISLNMGGIKRMMPGPYEFLLFPPSNYVSNIIMNNTIGIDFENVVGAIIARNIIKNNSFGIRLINSSNNMIYHNNFVDNIQQTEVTRLAKNAWDNGVEGNYWSDYIGVDELRGSNKDQPGSDGLGDTPYVIDANNTDRYPLMGPFNTFNAVVWNNAIHNVDIISNSTISDFHFNPDNSLLKFNVTGAEGTKGFCRVAIPKGLLSSESGKWIVLVDGQPVPYNANSNEKYNYIILVYAHSTKTVTIQGTLFYGSPRKTYFVL